VAFSAYASQWLDAQTFDQSTREAVALRFRLHVFPVLGRRHLSQIKPSTVQAWLRGMDALAQNYRTVIFANVSSVFSAAVDDELVTKNPCLAPSVRRPRRVQGKVTPWSLDQVAAVVEALPDRYGIVAVLGAGLGLRQGEIFGLSPGDVDFLRSTVDVRRQVKLYGTGRQAFALPKGGKTRTVPLPDAVRDALAVYLAQLPAVEVTLPWGSPGGEPVTVELVLTSRERKALARPHFNSYVWKPALVAADIPTTRANGCHALRHHFASVLLDAGESVKALSEYLGHSDPGFTLRTYTHLMPSSHDRTRRAIDTAWAGVIGVSAAAG
jgi:integrase